MANPYSTPYPTRDELRRQRSADLVALSLEDRPRGSDGPASRVLRRVLRAPEPSRPGLLPEILGAGLDADRAGTFEAAVRETVARLARPAPPDEAASILAARSLGLTSRIRRSRHWTETLADQLGRLLEGADGLQGGTGTLPPDREETIGTVLDHIRSGLRLGTTPALRHAGEQSGALLAALERVAPGRARELRQVGDNHYLRPGHESVRRHARVKGILVGGEFRDPGEVTVDPVTHRVILKRTRKG